MRWTMDRLDFPDEKKDLGFAIIGSADCLSILFTMYDQIHQCNLHIQQYIQVCVCLTYKLFTSSVYKYIQWCCILTHLSIYSMTQIFYIPCRILKPLQCHIVVFTIFILECVHYLALINSYSFQEVCWIVIRKFHCLSNSQLYF